MFRVPLALLFPFLLSACAQPETTTMNAGYLLAAQATAQTNDKTAHYLAGTGVARFVEAESGSPIAGCAASLFAGLLKEAIDANVGKDPDHRDVLATAAGCQVQFVF